MNTFKDIGLNPEIMKSLEDLGFETPSPIQAKVIPFILKSSTTIDLNEKKDLIALAQTGTGKTAAFSLPILQQLKADNKTLQAIILCPTRELCLQTYQGVKDFIKYSKNINVTAVYGGEKIGEQIKDLKRGTNIVVGTPGRVRDLIGRNVLKLGTIQWVVLDEADEMLDMGFKDELDTILEQTPDIRQTLLFSATISKSVLRIAKNYMHDYEEITVAAKNIGADKVSHEYYVVRPGDRFEALRRILDSLPGVYGILFCRTRRETQEVTDKLKQFNYDTEALHGEIAQNVRTKIMDRFKKKTSGLLVATDVAARGIDVINLSHVINYNLPEQNEGYTHRSGRTGRADKSGVSIAIVSPREVRKIKILEQIVGKTFEYKKVPSSEDIIKKQINNFINEIENADAKKVVNLELFSDFIDRLKKMKKEDLIKHFIANKFSDISEENNSRDLNADAKNNTRLGIIDGANLKINFGKKDGFDIKALFSLFNSDKKLKAIKLGRIDLRPNYSIFTVEKKYVAEVIKWLSISKFRGKKVVIMETDEAPSYQGSAGRDRSRSGRDSRDRRYGRNRNRSRSRNYSGGAKGRARYKK